MNEPVSALDTGLTPSPRVRPTQVRLAVVAVLMAYSFMNHLNRMSMAVAGEARIMPDYGLSPTQMGMVYSAFLLTYTMFMAPGGWLIDRVGPRRALLGVGFGTGLLAVATGLVGTLGLRGVLLLLALILVRGLMGMFAAPIYPATGQLVRQWMPLERRATSNGLVMAAALVAIASVYRILGPVINRVGWPVTFVLVGGATVGVALVWLLISTDWPAQHGGTNEAERALITGDEPAQAPALADRSALDVLRNRSVMMLTASYAAVGYFEYLLFYWLHHYFDKVLKLGADESAWYAGIPPLAMAACMPLGGWLSDHLTTRLGPRLGGTLVPAGGMLASALFLTLGVLATQPTWIVVWFALAMGAVGASEGPFWTTAVAIGGRRGGTTGAIVNTGGNAGGLLAPVITPWVGDHFGWSSAISLSSFFCVLGVVAWFWIDPRDRVS